MIKLNFPGILYPIQLRPDTSDEALYSQIFVHDEYGYIEMLKPPKVIVDAGANVGLSAIYFANKYKDARIIAIEPEDSNFSMLVKNALPYKNIVPVNAALWPQEGRVSLHDPGYGDLAYQTYYNRESTENNNIKCVTIDSLLKKYQIDYIDILKIDIEGAESELFNANCDWISKVSVIIIELHERLKSGCNKAFFNATKDHFCYEWIGGENFYLSKQGAGQPMLPRLFKHDNPDLLPIEQLWATQTELDHARQELGETQNRLEPIFRRINTLEQIYGRVDALEQIYGRVDELEQIYGRVDALEQVYSRVDALEQGLVIEQVNGNNMSAELARACQNISEMKQVLEELSTRPLWKTIRDHLRRK